MSAVPVAELPKPVQDRFVSDSAETAPQKSTTRTAEVLAARRRSRRLVEITLLGRSKGALLAIMDSA